ncbi:class I SAM-dependent methyltransferase [Paenibacillus sp. FSL L8-0709]|uniref:class I SAM-dependent methyltransferase n=1 Tax=Paenibacillus sp. FSL L8-0709 TaxID=2975312 RepID=UPI0030F8BFE6
MMMKRKGIHKPTMEDAIEISGIETLHTGGFDLTRRTAEVAALKPGMRVLDVSSGRGTQAIFYAENYGVQVTGIDISEKMIQSATNSAQRSDKADRISFRLGDSQALPFSDNSFDAVINECAVGIPDDSQQVLNEMVRVVKPGGRVVIHESIWKKRITDMEKEELSERYGTTPLELEEWKRMLIQAGAVDIVSEHEEWSKPERFWKVRKDRDVIHYSKLLTFPERVVTLKRILQKHGVSGVTKVMENEKVFFKAVMDGKIGYGLYRGVKGDIHGKR